MEEQRRNAGPGVTRVIADGAYRIWSAGAGVVLLTQRQAFRMLDAFARYGEAAAAERSRSGKRRDWLPGRVLDKLEEVFDTRVTRAMNALQIPTARDIKELSARVEELQEQVARLDAKNTSGKTTRKAPARKSPAKRTSKKTTPTTSRPPGTTEH